MTEGGLIPILLQQMPGLLFHLGYALITLVLTTRTAIRASRF